MMKLYRKIIFRSGAKSAFIRSTVVKYFPKTSITSSSISARLDKKKNPGKQARQLIIYYLAGGAPPRKTKPTLVAASTKGGGRKNEKHVSSVAEKIRRRGRHSVGLSANTSRAHTNTHTRVCVHIFIHVPRTYTHSCPHAVGCKLVLKNLEVN